MGGLCRDPGVPGGHNQPLRSLSTADLVAFCSEEDREEGKVIGFFTPMHKIEGFYGYAKTDCSLLTVTHVHSIKRCRIDKTIPRFTERFVDLVTFPKRKKLIDEMVVYY
jgi:hypothetical protein